MNILISNKSDKPIYEQIYSQITSSIISGELSEGQPLPSIRMLAKELKISVITVKKAYEILEQTEFIETVAGKGSFVSIKNPEMIKQSILCEVEEHLKKAVDVSKVSGIKYNELCEMLDILYNEK